MKRTALMMLPLLFVCSCAAPNHRGDHGIDSSRDMHGRYADQEPVCQRSASQPVNKLLLYSDYYGSILTTDTNWLQTPAKSYRWGIANSKPLSLAHFGAYVKPNKKYTRFRTNIYIDSSIKANMVFTFRAEAYNGMVLKNLTISPGDTETVDIDITGISKLYIGADLRINHDRAEKIIVGEPEFYTCR